MSDRVKDGCDTGPKRCKSGLCPLKAGAKMRAATEGQRGSRHTGGAITNEPKASKLLWWWCWIRVVVPSKGSEANWGSSPEERPYVC